VRQAPASVNIPDDISVPAGQPEKEVESPLLPLTKPKRREVAIDTKTIQDSEQKLSTPLSRPTQVSPDSHGEIPPARNTSVIPIPQAFPARRKYSLPDLRKPRAISAAPRVVQRQQAKPEAQSALPKLPVIKGLAKPEAEKNERLDVHPGVSPPVPGSLASAEGKSILPSAIQSKKEADGMATPAVSSPASPRVSPGSARLEAPLKKYMERRTQPVQAQFLKPEQVKPLVSAPKLSVSHPALIQRQKDGPHPQANSQPDKPVPDSCTGPAFASCAATSFATNFPSQCQSC
jgi:hypothetical protein